jgi:type II secretory pathway component PulM
MVKLIECKADSDVVAVRVRGLPGEVQVEIQDDPFEALTLITARLLPSQAVRLARALLNTVGAGSKVGNVETFIFID